MSQFESAFEKFKTNVTSASLECFASQIEVICKQTPKDQVKTALLRIIGQILHEDQFAVIRQDETMLRLYKIMCRVSSQLGGTGIYKQLNIKGYFSDSLKFYLQWAEECGKDKNLDNFDKVLNLARERIGEKMETSEIEAGFRDLGDEFFPGMTQNLFVNPDDTINLFEPRLTKNTQGKKAKRRSSVAFLRQAAPIIESSKSVFGPKTSTRIRAEFIDTPEGFGVSCEEFRYAAWRDECGEGTENKENKETRENRSSKRRPLSAVSERSIDEPEDEKRSRVFSPLVPTKDAHRQPLRVSNSNDKVPTTITLSEDTANDTSLDQPTAEENAKLEMMSAGKRENKRTLSKSGAGLDMMAENNCLEAHAMFSETVHLGSEKTLVIGNDSDDIPSKTLQQNVTTDYSVFCDPDPTMHIHQNDRPKKTSGGLNVVYDEQQPVEEEMKEVNPVISPSTLTTPTSFEDHTLLLEDEIHHGFGRLSRGNIVTSTPAVGVPFVDVEEYFGTKQEEQPPAFVPPSSSAFQKMMRRKSQAAAPVVPVVAVPQTLPVAANFNASVDGLTENLGRRLSLGADDILNSIEDAAETTGCRNRRRSEVMRGDVNPWDEDLRKKLMSLVRPPTNMHEFPSRSPKIQAMKTFEAGGEKFNIQTLIGQGGYAKVYRAVNEEEKTVAVKYEVPGCAWEVYICDQMRNRLIKDNDSDKVRMADWCIMQVIDAYIFSNASLLVNEYHEHGTLLELANNMKDPSWQIMCFLIVQMARILKEVHACKIIHGDIKPDNFIITRKIDSSWGQECLLSSECFTIKLIDWGRAIDMMPLPGRSFKGRAGTEGFDCPEMIDGRPWSYQADFFGFAASVAVIATGKYANLQGESVGEYSLNADIKRRNNLREVIQNNFKTFLNIPSCKELPSWDETINSFVEIWDARFDLPSWRQAVAKFNEACDLAKATRS